MNRKLLAPIPNEIWRKVMDIENDEDLVHLGYVCVGRVPYFTPGKTDYDNTWVWIRDEDEDTASVVFAYDKGNSNCGFQGAHLDKKAILRTYYDNLEKRPDCTPPDVPHNQPQRDGGYR